MKTKSHLFQICLLGAVLHAVTSQLAAQTIQNPDFETPFVGPFGNANGSSPNYTFQYYYSFETTPTNASWTFTGNAGIAANGSGFAFYNLGTPSGNQFAVLQGLSGSGASMCQTISNFPAGNYTFTFIASQRDIAGRDNTTNQTAIVLVDGVNVGSFTPADTNWYLCQTAPISLSAGNHVLLFTNNPVAGDATIRVDSVWLQSAILQTPPALGIGAYGNQTVVFWPASATNFVLQATGNLSSSNWTTVSNGMSFIAAGFSNSTPAQFFRLH